MHFLAVLSLCRCAGFFLVVAGAPSSSGAWASTALVFLLQSTGSRCTGFSSCGVWSQRLWCSGLVAPLHVGSSWTRDQAHVPCTGRRIPIHCATGEVPQWFETLNYYCCSLTQSCLTFETPWTAGRQASLSLTQSLPKFLSIASVMPSSHLIL